MIHDTPRDHRTWSDTPYEGIEFCWLKKHDRGGGTAILTLQKGAKLPAHFHLGWEQIFILSGTLKIAETRYQTGDFVFIEPNTHHVVEAIDSSQYLTISEKDGAEIL